MISPSAGARSTPKASAKGDLGAQLAPPAHLVEADCRERADKGEARGEREQQRQHLVAEGEPRQDEADHRIDQPEEDDIGAEGGEVAEPTREHFLEIRDPDTGDRRRWGVQVLAQCGGGRGWLLQPRRRHV